MTILHRSPRGSKPVACWCGSEHTSAQAVALNMRDTTPRTYPVSKEKGWLGGVKGKKKGRAQQYLCACSCGKCKRKNHSRCITKKCRRI